VLAGAGSAVNRIRSNPSVKVVYGDGFRGALNPSHKSSLELLIGNWPCPFSARMQPLWLHPAIGREYSQEGPSLRLKAGWEYAQYRR
jgi:hypothetical protein